MKTSISIKANQILVTSIVAVSLFFISICTSAQWYPQSSGTTENLEGIHFTDNLNGFAVGDKGVVIHTENGGLNWYLQILDSNYHFKDVFFLDEQIGWISGHNTDLYQQGRVYQTLNGGIDWVVIAEMGFSEILFFDTLNGLASGGVYKSTDGGVSWEEKFDYLPIYSICFTDSIHGWATGGWINGSTGYVTTYILNTSDGGDSWGYQFEHFARTGYFLYGICFIDSMNGYAVGGGPGVLCKRVILQTKDGGNNWDTIFIDGHHGRLYDICFPDQQNGWAVGGLFGGVIMHIEKSDEFWSVQTTLTEVKLNSICFPDETNGWIAGNNGTILHNNPTVQVAEPNNFPDHKPLNIYPNPFSISITIEFEATHFKQVEFSIYNQLGELIQKKMMKAIAGDQTFTWDPSGLPSGIYFIRMQVGNDLITRKMIKLN